MEGGRRRADASARLVKLARCGLGLARDGRQWSGGTQGELRPAGHAPRESAAAYVDTMRSAERARRPLIVERRFHA